MTIHDITKKKLPPYEIKYEKPAEKFFKKHEDVREEYENLIWERYCGKNPERLDIKILKGKKNEYCRMRIGDWRIIFTVDENNDITVIDTLNAGSRGDIYKKIGGLKLL